MGCGRSQNSRGSLLKVRGRLALLPCTAIGRNLLAKVGVVICGGNIDMRVLGTILNRNMMSDGRLVRLRIDISDEPGMLLISAAIGESGGNIEIYHQRMFYDVPAKLAKIDAVVDTRGQAHVEEIITALVARQFSVSIIDENHPRKNLSPIRKA